MARRQDASTGEIIEDNSELTEEQKLAAAANSKQPLMDVKVYAPFQVYFEGQAMSISAVNETGPFDILPKHHNFLTMLVPCDLVIKTPYDTQTISISRGLMHVKAAAVTVFLDV